MVGVSHQTRSTRPRWRRSGLLTWGCPGSRKRDGDPFGRLGTREPATEPRIPSAQWPALLPDSTGVAGNHERLGTVEALLRDAPGPAAIERLATVSASL